MIRNNLFDKTMRDNLRIAAVITCIVCGLTPSIGWAQCETCCVQRVGDVNGSGGDEPTISDVSALIDALFIATGATPIGCLAEADINRSAPNHPCDVLFSDLSIGDVSYLIDYLFITGSSLGLPNCEQGGDPLSYPIVETGQTLCYNNSTVITCPQPGEAFHGQDGCYPGIEPSYTDNGDSTITDHVTGLMWSKSPDLDGDGDIDAADKKTYDAAVSGAASFDLAGYDDWRLPTIKEQYSLIMFYGAEPNPTATSPGSAVPYIDTDYFDFAFGDLDVERIIDAQYATSTIYVSTTMGGNKTMFGVNFADGRIKGYPAEGPMWKEYYVMYVRDNPAYGVNNFTDNGDSTITDNATGLMWMQYDSDSAMNWEDALSYAENLEHADHSDWRLPDAKELQGIIDYSRSPSTTSSAAIDPIFSCTPITNEAGETDYPFYWSGTTFCSQSPVNGNNAVYVCFGRAMGYMPVHGGWVDVHGAGAQRSDPKVGDPDDYPYGHGPQGDAIRIFNYVRCVRTLD